MVITENRHSILSALLAVLIGGYAYGQTPKHNHHEISQAEYEIFSAFIARSFVGKAGAERVAFPVSQIIIVDTTEYDESEITDEMSWKEIRRFLRKQVPSLQVATMENFRSANVSQAALEKIFDLPLPYQLVAENTLDSIIHNIADWPQYYKKYPGAQGFLVLSRVGFSPDEKQAMFYVTNHCSGKCASWSFVVARKERAKWVVVKEVVFGAS